MLVALEDLLDPPVIAIVRGEASESATWRDELTKLYAPKRLVFAIPNSATRLPPGLADKTPHEETVAYVCRGMTCSEPVRSLSALVALTIHDS